MWHEGVLVDSSMIHNIIVIIPVPVNKIELDTVLADVFPLVLMSSFYHVPTTTRQHIMFSISFRHNNTITTERHLVRLEDVNKETLAKVNKRDTDITTLAEQAALERERTQARKRMIKAMKRTEEREKEVKETAATEVAKQEFDFFHLRAQVSR